jgi:hypothetical protein
VVTFGPECTSVALATELTLTRAMVTITRAAIARGVAVAQRAHGRPPTA